MPDRVNDDEFMSATWAMITFLAQYNNHRVTHIFLMSQILKGQKL